MHRAILFGLFGLVLALCAALVFAVHVFDAPPGPARIDAVCSPIRSVGSVANGLAAYAPPAQKKGIAATSAGVHFQCRLSLWSFFYKTDYEDFIGKQKSNGG